MTEKHKKRINEESKKKIKEKEHVALITLTKQLCFFAVNPHSKQVINGNHIKNEGDRPLKVCNKSCTLKNTDNINKSPKHTITKKLCFFAVKQDNKANETEKNPENNAKNKACLNRIDKKGADNIKNKSPEQKPQQTRTNGTENEAGVIHTLVFQRTNQEPSLNFSHREADNTGSMQSTEMKPPHPLTNYSKTVADLIYFHKCCHFLSPRMIAMINDTENAHHVIPRPLFKKYRCKFCHFRTHKQYNLDMHIRRQHPEVRTNFSCHLCGKSFIENDLLTFHMRSHSGHDDYSYVCGLCHLICENNVELDKHKKCFH